MLTCVPLYAPFISGDSLAVRRTAKTYSLEYKFGWFISIVLLAGDAVLTLYTGICVLLGSLQ